MLFEHVQEYTHDKQQYIHLVYYDNTIVVYNHIQYTSFEIMPIFILSWHNHKTKYTHKSQNQTFHCIHLVVPKYYK